MLSPESETKIKENMKSIKKILKAELTHEEYKFMLELLHLINDIIQISCEIKPHKQVKN